MQFVNRSWSYSRYSSLKSKWKLFRERLEKEASSAGGRKGSGRLVDSSLDYIKVFIVCLRREHNYYSLLKFLSTVMCFTDA